MLKLNLPYILSVIVATPVLYFTWIQLSVSPVMILLLLAITQPLLYFFFKLLLKRTQL
jgi:hypothetical protein